MKSLIALSIALMCASQPALAVSYGVAPPPAGYMSSTFATDTVVQQKYLIAVAWANRFNTDSIRNTLIANGYSVTTKVENNPRNIVPSGGYKLTIAATYTGLGSPTLTPNQVKLIVGGVVQSGYYSVLIGKPVI